MISDADRIKIDASKLFSPVGVEEVEHLFDTCAFKVIAPSETLIEPGKPNYNLYLVLEGALLVYPGGRGLPENIALGPGDCVVNCR